MSDQKRGASPKYCSRFLDDAPGIRGDCAQHLKSRKQCVTCPHRNIHDEVVDLRAALKKEKP